MPAIRLIKEQRLTPLLQTPSLGCLKGVPTINLTRGCLHSCVYCYSRAFTAAPPKGQVHLYENLPELLERELARKRRPPSWVYFSTACDPFQDFEEVLHCSYAAMQLLLARGIGVSFLTKGFIPGRVMDLFRKSPRLVLARIGLITLDEDLARRFEPFAAPPASRVMNIVNMVQAGVRVSVRIDPILPGISDSGESLSRLIETISSAGASALSISALVMRPRIARQLLEELPAPLARDILRHYARQPYQRVMTSERTQLLPRPLRLVQYARIKNIARRLNLPCSLCGCKNPDLPWESCDLGTDASRSVQRQLPLFQAK